MKNIIIVPILTFFFGFFSFTILSIYNGCFWFSENFDIPQISSTAVMIGDSLILPTINFMVFNLFFNILDKKHIVEYKKKLQIGLLLFSIISVYVNILSHENWSNDRISDFISFKQGGLTIAGYVHFVFSMLEIIILLLFPLLWYISIQSKNAIAIAYSKRIWKRVFLFTWFAIIDMFIKHSFFYKNKTLLESMRIERFPFLPCLSALVLFLVMRRIELQKSNVRANDSKQAA